MKKITLLLSFVACVLVAQAQVLLVEDFNYPIGNDIKSHGWPIHSGSGATKDSILVVDGLVFSGYIGSGIGGAAAVNAKYCDQNHVFTGQTSGAVYASFMLKSLGAVGAASYFLHFGPSTIGTTYFTRVWINITGDGLGIGASAPASYLPITLNTTYLVVIKYDFSTKVSSLNVFSTLPSIEPSTAQASFTETTGPAAATPTDIGTIALRQGNTSGTPNQNVVVDGIRITKSWAELFTATGFLNPLAIDFKAVVSGNKLLVNNVANGSTIEIYSVLGAKVQSSKLMNGFVEINNLTKGLYVVRVGKDSQKIML